MSRNIFGILLLSFIVGAIILAYENFAPQFETQTNVQNKISCGNAKVKLFLAVFNSKTKQLESSLTIEDKNDKFHSVVTYHFFVKEKGQAKYLRSETLRVVKNLQHIAKTIEEENSTFPWLENFAENGNLFIVIEYNQNELREVKSIPKFDEVTAVPVLFFQPVK